MMIWVFLLAREGEFVVVEVQGSVEWRRPEAETKWAKLAKDAKLKPGDQVQTGLKSRCVMTVGEATRVMVRASSFATLSKAFVDKNKVTGAVRLDVGSVKIDVAEKRTVEVDFKVDTPIGTASIRGTSITVWSSELGTDVQRHNGDVGVHQEYGPSTQLDSSVAQTQLPAGGTNGFSMPGTGAIPTGGTSGGNPTTDSGLVTPQQTTMDVVMVAIKAGRAQQIITGN